MTYAAFISYNSADRAAARRLQHALESYSIPRALRGTATKFGVIGERIGKVCRDRTDFKSGESLNAALAEALDRSSALVVLCSPDSARSKWVNAEVEHFKSSGRAARIFPVIVRTDETGVIVNSYPPALRREDGDEAIAADLQTAGDGWHDGVLKVLSSILDVDFDALRQRALVAARQRARVAYAIASGATALAAIAVASSVIAVNQRNRSLENFEGAIVIAARSASRINELANETEVPRELIYRFLTNTKADLESLSAMESLRRHPRAKIISAEFQLLLSDRFAEVGRTQDQLASSLAADETLKRIKSETANGGKRFIDSILFGEQNIEFFTDDLEGEVSESLGKAWLNAGVLDKARAEFERCRAARLNFVASWELDDEEMADINSGVLSCAANEANVLAMLNRPSAAIKALEAGIASAGEDAAAAPYAHLVLAQLYADNGRLSDSIALLTAEIARYGEAAEGRQERIELAKLFETRAKALALTGAIVDAAGDLARADALLGAFLAGDGDDRRVLLLRGELLTTSGEIAALGGDRQQADAAFASAESILTRLIVFDEQRRDFRLARARLKIARAENALRRYEADATNKTVLARGEENARGALADIDAIDAKGDDVAARLRLVAEVSLARLLRISGDSARASALLDAASDRLEKDGGPASTPNGRLRTAIIADERGDLATAARDFRAGRRHYDEAIASQKAYLAGEPAASLAVRDLLWTQIASARSLQTEGDLKALNARIREACDLKASAALKEYSLFVRDAKALDALARKSGVKC